MVGSAKIQLIMAVEKYINQPPVGKEEIKRRLMVEFQHIESLKVADEPQKEFVKEFAREFMKALTEAGGRAYESVDDLYKNFRGNLLVRREDPMMLVSALLNRESVKLPIDKNIAADGEAYPNCANWSGYGDNRGLQTAFMEGHSSVGKDQLITVVGFKEGRGLNVKGVSSEERVPGGLDREFVRVAEGVIDPEDIEFVVVRASKDSFPEDFLTPEERQSDSPYAFRGFDFSESEAQEIQLPKAA